MRYRKLDQNFDYTFGNDQAALWRDVPDAPAQAVLTRLMLFLGEWYLDTRDGTPWMTQVLGKYTKATRDMMVQSRTLRTVGVTSIAKFTSQVNPDTRTYSAQLIVNTQYGVSLPINVPK